MTITHITVACPDDTMGDTSPANCELFREWFTEQLQAKCPDASITVQERPGRSIIETVGDDDNDLEWLDEFQGECWDSCPFDFND